MAFPTLKSANKASVSFLLHNFLKMSPLRVVGYNIYCATEKSPTMFLQRHRLWVVSGLQVLRVIGVSRIGRSTKRRSRSNNNCLGGHLMTMKSLLLGAAAGIAAIGAAQAADLPM